LGYPTDVPEIGVKKIDQKHCKITSTPFSHLLVNKQGTYDDEWHKFYQKERHNRQLHVDRKKNPEYLTGTYSIITLYFTLP
jgi:hypothetical protein